MDDLISREKAINTAYSMRKVCDTDNIDDYHDLIVAALKDLPPSDAAEVVRCGECKYMMPNGACYVYADPYANLSASDFCSRGERKDDQPR